MRIQILRAKNGSLCMPTIDKYEKVETDQSFLIVRIARIKNNMYDTATIYLSNRNAVLKLMKHDNVVTHYDVRSFNFSLNSREGARAMFKLLVDCPYIKEHIQFSRNAKII